MKYKVYKDTGAYPSMCGLIVPEDGRDTEAEARKLFGSQFKVHSELDSAEGFEPQADNPGCYSCFFY